MAEPRRIYVHAGLNANTPVSAQRFAATPEVSAQHVCDTLQLLWNDVPLTLHVGGERVELAEPTLVIVPALTPHIAESPDGDLKKPVGANLVILERALLGAADHPTLQPGALSPEENATVLPVARLLHERLTRSRDRVSSDHKLLAQGLLALLRELGYGSAARQVRNLDPVQRALEVLYERFPEPDLQIEDLARAADLSVAQFRRVFKQVIGEPPLSYLARHRLEQARLLLIEDKLTVAAIARRVGFQSPGSFYARFMRAYGHSPRNKSRKAILRELARTWAPAGTYRPKKMGRGTSAAKARR